LLLTTLQTTTELNINPVRQRLRCLGHIINLVSLPILYGIDDDCVDEVLQALDKDAGARANANADS